MIIANPSNKYNFKQWVSRFKREKSLAILSLLRYFGLRGGLLSLMFIRATSIFALAGCFFGCAAQVTTQPPSVPPQPVLLPDLTILDISLSGTGRVEVTISNVGKGFARYGVGSLLVYVDGQMKWRNSLAALPDQTFLTPGGRVLYTTPVQLVGRHEIRAVVVNEKKLVEENEANNVFVKVLGKEKIEVKPVVPAPIIGEKKTPKKVLDGLPAGPDIVVKDLDLSEDLELMIILSNAGQVDLRKDVIFQIQIFVNDQKISEFDHFIREVLKANSGNRYIIDPPFYVGITGISKVKVAISPELSSDDIRLKNNVLERTFVIFPFRIGPQRREEFSFPLLPARPRVGGQTEKVKIEARWEESSSSLMLSFKKSRGIKGVPTLSGKSPLKLEFPIAPEEIEKENDWSICITNHAEKKVEGHLIIQHPW
jgi:hypothetical protein